MAAAEGSRQLLRRSTADRTSGCDGSSAEGGVIEVTGGHEEGAWETLLYCVGRGSGAGSAHCAGPIGTRTGGVCP